MVIESFFAFIAGMFVREWARAIASMFKKKKPPPPDRDVGDLVLHIKSGLPLLLLEEMTHGTFSACYITPYAANQGAVVGNENESVDELDLVSVKNAHDRISWPDYTNKLSDRENANYAKAMLTIAK